MTDSIHEVCSKIEKTASQVFELFKIVYGVDAVGRTQVLSDFVGLKKAELELKMTRA